MKGFKPSFATPCDWATAHGGSEEMISFPPAGAVPLDIDKLSIDASIDYRCATYWKT